MANFRSLFRSSRPIYLFLAVMAYTLGTGIAHYLGKPMHVLAYCLGLLVVLALQAAAFLLAEYFRLPLAPLEKGETPHQRLQYRTLLLQASAAALTLSAAATFSLLYARLLSLPVDILLILVFLVPVAYAVPPLRLEGSGFGELVLAFSMATLFPAFSFLLQAGAYHRLLAMTTFPLTLLALAYLLILDFPTFATDQKLAHHTLLTRLTWPRAIPIHHLLILFAFLIFAADPFFGFPWRLIWPVFLVLPFAGFEIFWLQRIAGGGRTLWIFLTTLAVAVFGLTSYLLTLTFWIH